MHVICGVTPPSQLFAPTACVSVCGGAHETVPSCWDIVAGSEHVVMQRCRELNAGSDFRFEGVA